MKLSLRILLINFVIVLLILGSSAVAIFTTMQTVLNEQRTQNIQNSARNFSYVFSNQLQKSDYEFAEIIDNNLSAFLQNGNLNNSVNDFVIELNDEAGNFNKVVFSPRINKPKGELQH
jgi:hypothetical protein